MRVAIIGGGIAGLAAAYYLESRGQGQVEYTLLERASVLGGKIATEREDGFVIEGGPDSFITYKPAALELCYELGLQDDLIGTNNVPHKTWVWSRGKLHPMPDGVSLIVPTKIMPFMKSPLISWRGKLRMGMDWFIPPRSEPTEHDESLANFVRRRLGDEALDKIAEPMIAGIYVADAEDLSLQSTFPRFLEMEQKYGSLLRGAMAQNRDTASSRSAPALNENGHTPTSMFMTLRYGIQQLTEALIARCHRDALQTGSPVVQVRKQGETYRLTLASGEQLDADAVILASPAYVSADLVRDLDEKLALQLSSIPYASSATVSFGFKRSEIHHPLDGYGFVVPRSEKRKIIACTWSSTKFHHRAPDGHVLIRAYIGGANREAFAEQEDATLIQTARDELHLMMGITGEPEMARVYRWQKANPQYRVGHKARVAAMERRAAQHGGLYLIGSAYRGVGIPDCIADGARVAAHILSKSNIAPRPLPTHFKMAKR